VTAQTRFDAVRRAYDAFNAADVAAFKDLATDDIEIHDLATMPEQQLFRGKAGIEGFFEANLGAWEAVWGEIERLLEAGNDRVLALARHVGRARGGTEIAQLRGVLVTFSDTDKIIEIRFFADQSEALAAAGLNHTTA
jgi:ketosteroid isomerase-like protein